MFMCEVPQNRRVCGSNTEIHQHLLQGSEMVALIAITTDMYQIN